MILLVEDSEDDVFLMDRALRKTGLSLPMNVATDGREALDYLQAIGKYSDRSAYPIPSLIFLDLKIPYIHDFEVLRWIRQQVSLNDIPVVVLTSSLEESDRQKACELGATNFFVKPPTPDVLVKFFRSVAGFPAKIQKRAGA